MYLVELWNWGVLLFCRASQMGWHCWPVLKTCCFFGVHEQWSIELDFYKSRIPCFFWSSKKLTRTPFSFAATLRRGASKTWTELQHRWVPRYLSATWTQTSHSFHSGSQEGWRQIAHGGRHIGLNFIGTCFYLVPCNFQHRDVLGVFLKQWFQSPPRWPIFKLLLPLASWEGKGFFGAPRPNDAKSCADARCNRDLVRFGEELVWFGLMESLRQFDM